MSYVNPCPNKRRPQIKHKWTRYKPELADPKNINLSRYPTRDPNQHFHLQHTPTFDFSQKPMMAALSAMRDSLANDTSLFPSEPRRVSVQTAASPAKSSSIASPKSRLPIPALNANATSINQVLKTPL